MGYCITLAETASQQTRTAAHEPADNNNMDPHVRGAGVLQRDLKVLNQKEERYLQQKLNMLDKQHRFTRKMLQQRRDSLMTQRSRVGMVKVCEPKATVNIAMEEIGEHKNEMQLRAVQTSDGRRSGSGSGPVEQSRSVSAPPPLVKSTSPVRRRGNMQSSVSLLQMKNIATIDSISEKEMIRRQQRDREEVERLRRLQRETLHKKVAAFIEKLKEKNNKPTETQNDELYLL